MPHYRIHMINSDFQSFEDDDYPSLERALRAGVLAAASVASEKVAAGDSNSAIEIRIEEGDRIIARRIVAFSISDLAIGE